MGKFKDLTGQKFNRLTALYPLAERKNKSVVWHCICECGNECDVVSASLTRGATKSCGCLKKESDRKSKNNVLDETGKKYGHLTAIERMPSDRYGHTRWKCKCDCGNPNEIIVYGDNLRRGHTRSCGCERRSAGEQEIAKILNKNNIKYKQEVGLFKYSNGVNARFDFYINDQYLIEYDGETHYQYNLHGWHDKKQLKAQQERDILKNQWCKDNNIPLIRIPYWHLQKLCIEDLLLETSNFIVKDDDEQEEIII